MSTATHPQVAEAFEQLKRFNSALRDQMYRTNTGFFTATDEDKTVNVTINGQRTLTGLYIEDGLLRLGPETVEQRINEALSNAQAAATEAFAEQQEQLIASLAEATAGLQKALGLT
jgi:DNA-binding protein YbaB